MLTYWFYPNPGGVPYSSPNVLGLLLFCTLLFLSSFLISLWRSRLENPVTRRLSASWPSTLRWFGAIGMLLVISRVEQIQFLAMRGLWVLWVLAALAFLIFHLYRFRLQHYTIVKRQTVSDPRLDYLPQGRQKR